MTFYKALSLTPKTTECHKVGSPLEVSSTLAGSFLLLADFIR